jgi:hypothetical protein
MGIAKEWKQTSRLSCNKMWKFGCCKVSSSIFASVSTSRLLNFETIYETFSDKTSHTECCKNTRYFPLIYICYALIYYKATCLASKLTTKKTWNLRYSEIQVLWNATAKPFSIFITASQSQSSHKSFEENVTSLSRIY